jgi:glutaconyl-CoA decarboxylase
MKYKVTLNGKVYEIVVERGEAMVTDEYDAPPAAAAAPAPVPAAAPTPAPAPVAAPAPAPVVAAAPAPVPVAPAAAASAGGEVVKAPLPGTIFKIITPAGTVVKAGDIILILEAMKMENEIMAPCSGTVTEVMVTEGKSVNNGDVLLVIK